MINSQPIPLNILDFIDNFNSDITNFKYKASCVVSFGVFLSLIKYGKRDGKFSFSSNWLRKFVGLDLNKIVDILIENGFLEMTNNYYAGSSFRKFRFVKDKMGEIKYFPLRHFGELKYIKQTPFEKLLAHFAEKDAQTLKDMGKLADTVKFIKQIDCDEEKIEEYIEEVEQKDEGRGAKNRIAWESFKGQQTFCSVSKVGGRLYTSFANLSKGVKRHLSIDGEDIWEVDISCAQPLFLSKLYDGSDQDPEYVAQEKKAYLSAVDGDIYTLIGATGAKRDKIKKDFYNVFFGKLGRWNKELFNNFRENFPILAEEILKIKKGNYKELAHKLQRTESDIIVHGAYLEFLNKFDGEFALTIHDSIATKKKHLPVIKDLVEKHCKLAGFSPKIKFKKLGEE
jgi:hypothetical protein